MKKFILALLISFFAMIPTFAQSDISSDDAKKGIIGEWKLLSFEKKDIKDDYSNQNIIWKFDKKRFSVESKDLGSRYEDNYKLMRSYFRITNTVIIISEKLKNTHLPHGKFVVKHIKGDILTLSDWDDETTYTLKNTKIIKDKNGYVKK